VLGVPGFVLEHLELRHVGYVFDTCGIAQASDKMGKTVAKTIRSYGAWRLVEDKATCHDAKRQLTDQAANDGIASSQKLDLA